MIKEIARVVECHDGITWVETARKSACDSCTMKNGCGTGAISRVFGKNRVRIQAVNKINAHEGDEVLIGIEESALLIGSFLIYFLPLVSMLGFALLGEVLSGQLLIENRDIAPAVLGGTGLLLAMYWVRKKTSGKNANRYQAIILRNLDSNEGCQL